MQNTIALSTAEAEYYSAPEIAVEIIYLESAKPVDIRKQFAHEVIQNRHSGATCDSSGFQRMDNWLTSLQKALLSSNDA
jgi:hypothetical protein